MALFIFGSFWGGTYLYQYEIIRTDFLQPYTSVISFRISFLCLFQISRDIAKLIIYPTSESLNAKPILIYGAGTAGNELFNSIKQNPRIKIVGFLITHIN